MVWANCISWYFLAVGTISSNSSKFSSLVQARISPFFKPISSSIFSTFFSLFSTGGFLVSAFFLEAIFFFGSSTWSTPASMFSSIYNNSEPSIFLILSKNSFFKVMVPSSSLFPISSWFLVYSSGLFGFTYTSNPHFPLL